MKDATHHHHLQLPREHARNPAPFALLAPHSLKRPSPWGVQSEPSLHISTQSPLSKLQPPKPQSEVPEMAFLPHRTHGGWGGRRSEATVATGTGSSCDIGGKVGAYSHGRLPPERLRILASWNRLCDSGQGTDAAGSPHCV